MKTKKIRVPKPIKVKFKDKKIEEDPKNRIFDFMFIGFFVILMIILGVLYYVFSLDKGFWRESQETYGAIILVFVFLGIVIISIFISRAMKD